LRKSPRRTGIPPKPTLDREDLGLKRATPGGYRNVLQVALPLIISTGSLTVMLFVDRMFLSWSSPEAVAASSPGGITYFTICSVFLGAAQYINTIVAQYHGKGHKTACSRAVWQGLIFTLICAPLIIASIIPGLALISLAGHSEKLMELESKYFVALMFGGIALPLNASVSSFFSGRGKTRIVMWGNIIGNSANIGLDYILIFGKLGFPELGIQGAGIASAITNFLPGLFWLWIFLSQRYQAEYQTRASIGWDKKIFLMLLTYGIPSGIQFCLDVGAFTFFVLIVGRLGALELAVNNIALTIEMLAFLPMVGMSIATATLVGEYIGRDAPDIAEKSAFSGLKLAALYSMIFALLFLLIPESFLQLFLPETQGPIHDRIMSLGKRLLTIVALYTVFDNTSIIMTGALNGAGDTRFTMWTQIGVSWGLFIPGVYVTVEILDLGLFAAWTLLLGYVTCMGVVFFLRFRRGRWKEIRMLERYNQ
jgi:MATE family multidrug resistance protein